jgi:hypothetical protein
MTNLQKAIQLVSRELSTSFFADTVANDITKGLKVGKEGKHALAAAYIRLRALAYAAIKEEESNV